MGLCVTLTTTTSLDTDEDRSERQTKAVDGCLCVKRGCVTSTTSSLLLTPSREVSIIPSHMDDMCLERGCSAVEKASCDATAGELDEG
ncbi:hypothetical protein Ddye_001843 [Dipteronia dyeriana]|uniref:Uncharacterized protein n=1 Tax=Dipteronia dyeriana TaxID=168575 RepID=A0AAD9XPB3_9ROSI|nr:hypothetical protein Ddye_001843 [Dipteronia dyeriana]